MSDAIPPSPLQARDKRSKAYYDVIFDPDDTEPFLLADWALKSGEQQIHKTLDAKGFEKAFKPKIQTSLARISYYKCDFDGDFESFTPSFKHCKFSMCDFGLSKWRRAHFKNCDFSECSLSLASFIDCEFRDCRFTKIFLSGNETILNGTVFTSPEVFISSAYTNLDKSVIANFAPHKSVDYQKMRLEGTKANVARVLMVSSSGSGDEKTYYEAVKVYQLVSMNSKIMKEHDLLAEKPAIDKAIGGLFRLGVLHLERSIILLAGFVSAWGASIARPLIIGGIIIFFFGLIYYIFDIKEGLANSLLASADITMLAGYTKQSSSSDCLYIQFLFSFHMIISLFWYSIFIATIVGRVSRVR